MNENIKTKKRVRKHRFVQQACCKDIVNLVHTFEKPTSTKGSFEETVHIESDNNAENDLDERSKGKNYNFYNIPQQEELALSVDALQDPRVEVDFSNNCPEYDKRDVAHKLRVWALQCNIQHNHLDKLLQILREEAFPTLPKSAKSFLGTTTADYLIVNMDAVNPMNICGEFVYLGIEAGIKQNINIKIYNSNVIELMINVDGLPVTASGNKSFWPILGKIYHVPDVFKPFPIAIFYGVGKPKIGNYLAQFIEELNELQKNGIQMSGNRYKVQLKCFISDTPARSYLKCTKGHSGYSACERCMVPGESIRTGNGSRVVYLGKRYKQRTKSSFLLQEDPEHHTGISPLLNIKPSIDLTKIFVLDFMHLCCNGVMKKLLQLWMSGPLKIRWGRNKKIEISRRIMSLRAQVPLEFQRKPRPLYEHLKWKATEFRYFLLYCGPFVLKSALPSILYNHFLLFHVACRILCSDELVTFDNYVNLAKRCLKKFVSALPYLYGPESVVINMHNLLHLADDVQTFGCCLNRINCFPFESFLGKIKRTLIRTPNKPLSQVCRRLHEQKVLEEANIDIPVVFEILKSYIDSDQVIIIEKVKFHFMTISNQIPDNMVILKDNTIMEIVQICSESSSLEAIIIRGRIWTCDKLQAYKYPVDSTLLNIWELSLKSFSFATYRLHDIKQKMVRLKLSLSPKNRDKFFIVPLLHS